MNDILQHLDGLGSLADVLITVVALVLGAAAGYLRQRRPAAVNAADAIAADIGDMLEEVEPTEDPTVPDAQPPATDRKRATRAAAEALTRKQHERLMAAFDAQDRVAIARYQMRIGALGLPIPETADECAAALRLMGAIT